MRVAIACDHGGISVKNAVWAWCRQRGYEVLNMGTDTEESVDYPDYAKIVAEAVAWGKVDRGVLVCTNGIGMCMAANKVHGVRAALVRIPENAVRSRAHNDANVLCLAGQLDTPPDLPGLLTAWFDTPFEGGRHARRVKKIMDIEG
ncbi:ribose 5-phosphate isomerase B [bacterium]|nr:ribose 5-phosphate isomerase B [bacterium]